MSSENPNSDTLQLIAKAAFGLEKVVVRELKDLGYEATRVEDGRIWFEGDWSALCRANLWLRCAERVQVVAGEYKAVNFDELFDQSADIHWENWLPIDARFPVDARCVRSEIRSVPNVQKMIKRSIVERLRKVYHRHWFDESGHEYPIDCTIFGDTVLLTIDASGDGLHKRGYRLKVSAAPIRETVAAGLVKLSYWNRDRLLVDPFCGSGTIPIEAAMIGRNLAPGRNRHFTCEDWDQIPKKVWTQARQECRDLEKPHLPIPIIARDRDRRVIFAAKDNAKEAGVRTDILFENKEFYTFPTDRDWGVLICNPPYGERIGERDEVKQLHADMGELLIPLDTWSLYILTGAENFEREFGKRADRRRKLFNARIACTYFQYLGPRPSSEMSAEAATEQPITDEQVPSETTDSDEEDVDEIRPADRISDGSTKSLWDLAQDD